MLELLLWSDQLMKMFLKKAVYTYTLEAKSFVLFCYLFKVCIIIMMSLMFPTKSLRSKILTITVCKSNSNLKKQMAI